MKASNIGFVHRLNRDGSHDSICPACPATVATTQDEAELRTHERTLQQWGLGHALLVVDDLENFIDRLQRLNALAEETELRFKAVHNGLKTVRLISRQNLDPLPDKQVGIDQDPLM
jgi:hypothetical protein